MNVSACAVLKPLTRSAIATVLSGSSSRYIPSTQSGSMSGLVGPTVESGRLEASSPRPASPGPTVESGACVPPSSRTERPSPQPRATSATRRKMDRMAHTLAMAAIAGKPILSGMAAAKKSKRGSKKRAVKRAVASEAIALRCGEALCKSPIDPELARRAKWPLECPACGIALYPIDVLESSAELAPDHACLMVLDDGKLRDCTSVDLGAPPTLDHLLR